MNKKCKNCKSQKPKSDFYAHKAMKDGLLNVCKECIKNKVSQRYYKDHKKNLDKDRERYHRRKNTKSYQEMKQKWVEKNKEHISDYRKKWNQKNRDIINEYSKKMREKHSYKVKARSKLYSMIRNGKIKKEPCFCGETKVQAHHEDYSKPFDIVWLCSKHHGEMHRKLKTPF